MKYTTAGVEDGKHMNRYEKQKDDLGDKILHIHLQKSNIWYRVGTLAFTDYGTFIFAKTNEEKKDDHKETNDQEKKEYRLSQFFYHFKVASTINHLLIK